MSRENWSWSGALSDLAVMAIGASVATCLLVVAWGAAMWWADRFGRRRTDDFWRTMQAPGATVTRIKPRPYDHDKEA